MVVARSEGASLPRPMRLKRVDLAALRLEVEHFGAEEAATM